MRVEQNNSCQNIWDIIIAKHVFWRLSFIFNSYTKIKKKERWNGINKQISVRLCQQNYYLIHSLFHKEWLPWSHHFFIISLVSEVYYHKSFHTCRRPVLKLEQHNNSCGKYFWYIFSFPFSIILSNVSKSQI